MAYYPKWVYSPNESITRRNMKEYDKRYDEYTLAYKKRIAEIEKEKGVSLTSREKEEIKYSMRDEFNV